MTITDRDRLKERLSALYADLSKHSVYQNIPGFVSQALGFRVRIDEQWRGDQVRLSYIESRLSSPGLVNWCDFGANTGYFAFTLAHEHPERRILAVEANANHVEFMDLVRQAFDVSNVTLLGEAISLDSLDRIRGQDVLLHLNVLHHAGSDFDRDRVRGVEDFPAYAHEYLSRLTGCTRHLVFQVGTNLWGDKARPVVDYRDDASKLALLVDLLRNSGWDVGEVAYATRSEGAVSYRPADTALTRALATGVSVDPVRIGQALEGFRLHEHPGEFYRRPLFLCEARG